MAYRQNEPNIRPITLAPSSSRGDYSSIPGVISEGPARVSSITGANNLDRVDLSVNAHIALAGSDQVQQVPPVENNVSGFSFNGIVNVLREPITKGYQAFFANLAKANLNGPGVKQPLFQAS